MAYARNVPHEYIFTWHSDCIHQHVVSLLFMCLIIHIVKMNKEF